MVAAPSITLSSSEAERHRQFALAPFAGSAFNAEMPGGDAGGAIEGRQENPPIAAKERGSDEKPIDAACGAMYLIMVLMVFILIAFPDLATWLPEQMRPGPA